MLTTWAKTWRGELRRASSRHTGRLESAPSGHTALHSAGKVPQTARKEGLQACERLVRSRDWPGVASPGARVAAESCDTFCGTDTAASTAQGKATHTFEGAVLKSPFQIFLL